MTKKKFYESWTFWFNVLAVFILGIVGIQAPISTEWQITALGLVNLLLRVKTKRAII